MQSEQLIQVAHQLIETANLLIKAASQPKEFHQLGATEQIITQPEDERFRASLLEAGASQLSKHSQFASRTEKIQNLQSQLEFWNEKLTKAKTEGDSRKARVMVGTYKGHLKKAMNEPSAGKKGGAWKSRV